MAEELASPSAELDSVGQHPSTPARAESFPAAPAVVALALHFVLSRTVIMQTYRERASQGGFLLALAITAGVMGTVLACGSVLQDLRASAKEHKNPLESLRLFGFLPLMLLLVVSMVSEAPTWAQAIGLGGCIVTLVWSAGSALARAGTQRLGQTLMLTLLLGELAALGSNVLDVLSPVQTAQVSTAERAALVGELCAFLGSAVGLVWSAQASVRIAGASRTRFFALLPLFVGFLILLLAASVSPIWAQTISHNTFGARLVLMSTPSTGVVLAYLAIPLLLLAAASISIAGVYLDRGASARRAMGWVCLLLAGFGHPRMGGLRLADPVHLMTLTLGVVLLERALVLEAQERSRRT